MSRIDEACEFAFEFKKKYEIKLETLEYEFNHSLEDSEDKYDEMININHTTNDQNSLKNMIPITEVDNDEMQKKTSRTQIISKNFEKQLISRQFTSENSNPTFTEFINCLLYTSPSPRDLSTSRMPSSA